MNQGTVLDWEVTGITTAMPEDITPVYATLWSRKALST